MKAEAVEPEVSFIIPCYHCRRTIGFTLKSIFSQETVRDFEVLVIDSSGGEVSNWIRSSFPKVQVIPSQTRLYPGAARNLGAEHARGRLLAFVDADVTLAPDWLESILRQYEAGESSGMIGGSMINGNPDKLPSRVLYWIEFSEFLPGHCGGLRPALPSSNLLISRQLFLRSGRFRSDLAMSEDIEFSVRVPAPRYFEPAARCFHHHRSRWNPVIRRLRELGYWSGRVRTEGKRDLRKPPLPLIPVLPFYRLYKIVTRAFRSSSREGLSVVLHTPFLITGLFFWTLGFFQGMRR
ncbi:MAG TPA: glycosyltransferase family 2 protein [Acidobacteriota bacterium]|nr:glycosyltransferase family 2 protein [Acidobacteriota bacterium]